MSRKSNIERLPPSVKARLDAELEKHNYGDCVAIAADFRKRGWKISKSALGRYMKHVTDMKKSARFEAEVLSHLGEPAAWLVRWARANPKQAARLVARLRAQQEQRGAKNDGQGMVLGA